MKVRRGIAIGLLFLFLTACASKEVVLELRGSIIYERPQISAISHSVADERREGGTVVVTVSVHGDPGLTATFDISPGIVDGRPMTETAPGHYSGQFSFPTDLTGGPFTIIGRLQHEEAGEVTKKDPDPVTISLVR
jgi:starvation-inducible outer membrane lipoprotein